jgi:hypothetical protein
MEIINATEVKLPALLTNLDQFTMEKNSQLKCFPNPVQADWLNWHLKEVEGKDENVSLRLFDLQGKLVLALQNQSFSGRLDLSGIKAGTYLLHLSSADQQWSQKVIKLP